MAAEACLTAHERRTCGECRRVKDCVVDVPSTGRLAGARASELGSAERVEQPQSAGERTRTRAAEAVCEAAERRGALFLAQ